MFGKKDQKKEYLREARRASRQGEYDRAGDLYYLAGDIEEATKMYVQGGHFGLAAQMYEKMGDLRNAAEFYGRGKDMRRAATLFEMAQDYNRASQIYESVGEHYKAAQVEEKNRKYSRAAQLYEKAGHLDRAAQMLAKDMNFVKAAETLKKFVEARLEGSAGIEYADETLQKYLRACGDFYLRARRYHSAARIFEDLRLHSKAAEAYEQGGEYENALRMYLAVGNMQKADSILETVGVSYFRAEIVAEVLLSKGRLKEAADKFTEAGLHDKAAEAYEQAGNFVMAAEAYERFGDYVKAGDLFLSMNQPARAAELFKKGFSYDLAAQALEKEMQLEEAAECYVKAGKELKAAEIYFRIHDYDQSIGLLQRIPPEVQDYPEACFLLGENFLAKEHYTLAEKKFREAIGKQGISDGTLGPYYGLAAALEKTGGLDEAYHILEKILSHDYHYKDAQKKMEALSKRMAMAGAGGGLGQMAVAGFETEDRLHDHSSVASRYSIMETISTSAEGETFKAWDKSLSRTVILRKIPVRSDTDHDRAQRILQEARQTSKVTHSHIVNIYDTLETGEGVYIVMEHVQGKTLRAVLQEGKNLHVSLAIDYAAQITETLSFAHQNNLLHRNLKPESIIVSENGRVKLCDFGIGKRVKDIMASGPIDGISPLAYVPPEQFRGEKLTERSDIYSLGVCIYEMLTGKPPFAGDDIERQHLEVAPEPLSNLIQGVPAQIEKVVMKCLEKNPGNRYLSVRQVFEDLKTAELMPGAVVSDRYELLKELGYGGMGMVFKARDRELDEVIAIKLLRPEFGIDPAIEQRFIRELKLARKVIHPSVVNVFDIGKWRGIKYITMEFIEGDNLDAWIHKEKSANIPEVSSFVIQICEALEAAHRIGVFHRDIKPQNVIITSGKRVKIVDFGIARLKSHDDFTSSGQILGSPKYMSPEQVRGGVNLDHRTDIYSLGVLMYYMFTGVEPFTGETPNAIIYKQLNENPIPPCQVNPNLPPWVEMIILKSMIKNPSGRYQRAAHIARDFIHYLK